MRLLNGLLLALGICSIASAGIIQADFQEVLDLPATSAGPRVEQLNGVMLPSGAPQLTAANIISNPSPLDGSLEVSFDSTTNILSLTGDTQQEYQIITVTLSNLLFDIPGQQVMGIAPISIGNAVDMTPNLDPFTTTPLFTANSFSVTYSVADLGNLPPSFFIEVARTDTFQVELGTISDVPEPATLGLLAFGAAALFAYGRRRRRAA
jgi:hypothetical protein